MRFRDRTDAGRQLAQRLEPYRNQPTIIYALPRGGVVLAVEVATALGAPLDLVIPRKIGHPYNPEYAICAVAENGELVCNEQESSRLDPGWLQQQVAHERAEARRRRQLYLGDRPPLPATGKTAIVVDDGIATGLTMIAAIHDLRQRQPARLVIAVPVAPRDTADYLATLVDEVVGLDISDYYLGAVGAYYNYFPQVSDAEVISLLQRSVATVEPPLSPVNPR